MRIPGENLRTHRRLSLIHISVELNEATIAKYIRKQEKQDQIEDELYTKEYEDPFKGVAKESVHNILNKALFSA